MVLAAGTCRLDAAKHTRERPCLPGIYAEIRFEAARLSKDGFWHYRVP